MTHPLSSAVMYSRLMGRARLRHLQLLLAIADESSLHRGAEDVGMSQPAATQALSELEHLLELPLFERHAKGMRLTPAGESLVPVVRRMLRTLRDSTESLEALHEGGRGLLRLGLIAAVSSAFVGERLLRFGDRHPKLTLEIVEDDGADLVQQLLAGSLHLVVGRRPQPVPRKLHFEPLRPDEALVIAGTGHPLAARRGLALEDLAEYRWMRALPGLWVREVFDDLFVRAGMRPRLHPLSVGSLGPLIEILRDDRTVALIPASLGRAMCRWGMTVVLDVRLGTSRGEIGLLCPEESLDDPLFRDLVEALR